MGDVTLTIDGDFGPDAVQSLKEHCIAGINENSSITLDFSKTAHIDNNGILFLAQLGEYLRGKRISGTLTGLTTELTDGLSVLGFADTFALRSVE